MVKERWRKKEKKEGRQEGEHYEGNSKSCCEREWVQIWEIWIKIWGLHKSIVPFIPFEPMTPSFRKKNHTH